jgi:hypothetical protein
VVSSGTATVPEWNASFPYKSYRPGVAIGNFGATTPLLYTYQTENVYFSDAACQSAELIDGSRGDHRMTLESWVTLADGTQAVRGTNVTTLSAGNGQTTVTRYKVMLRLNSTEGVNTLSAATSAAGATAYPEGSSMRRHTVGYQSSAK